MKARFQNPVGAISESRPVGNRSSLLHRETTDNEPTNPIYEIRSSFKNFQSMSITDSLYRPAGFACVLPLCVNLNVDLKVAGTLMKINLLFG